jgi:hypothetical protein
MTGSSPLPTGRQARTIEITQRYPPPLMGEGEGGGEQLSSFPPHLNPLPPGERRHFLRNFEYQSFTTDYLTLNRFSFLWHLPFEI